MMHYMFLYHFGYIKTDIINVYAMYAIYNIKKLCLFTHIYMKFKL